MKYKSMIGLIAGAGLALGSFSAMAGSGWAFNYSGEPVQQQTAKKKASSGGSGWAFDHSGEAVVKKSNETSKKSKTGGAGWAFDHPHEPVSGSSSRS